MDLHSRRPPGSGSEKKDADPDPGGEKLRNTTENCPRPRHPPPPPPRPPPHTHPPHTHAPPHTRPHTRPPRPCPHPPPRPPPHPRPCPPPRPPTFKNQNTIKVKVTLGFFN